MSGRGFPGRTRTDSASDAGWVIANSALIADRFSIAPNYVLLRAPTSIAACAILFATTFSKTLLMLLSREIGL